MQLKIGANVTWISSGTYKVGEVVAIVPAGMAPKDAGYPKIDAGQPRDHESYIVRGKKLPRKGAEPQGPNANYWPRVSLLEAD